MPARQIVIGQAISPIKAELARQMRREMTPQEKTLWQHLRANRLRGLHFRRQQIMDGFIVDFYCHAAGLVVEVDGPIHDKQVEYDAERDHVLAQRGLRVLRIRNDDITDNLVGVLEQIALVCGVT